MYASITYVCIEKFYDTQITSSCTYYRIAGYFWAAFIFGYFDQPFLFETQCVVIT